LHAQRDDGTGRHRDRRAASVHGETWPACTLHGDRGARGELLGVGSVVGKAKLVRAGGTGYGKRHGGRGAADIEEGDGRVKEACAGWVEPHAVLRSPRAILHAEGHNGSGGDRDWHTAAV